MTGILLKIWLVAAFLLTILCFGLIIQKAVGEPGPCVQSEIQMHFNVATKTMMPVKVCVLRGDWVE